MAFDALMVDIKTFTVMYLETEYGLTWDIDDPVLMQYAYDIALFAERQCFKLRRTTSIVGFEWEQQTASDDQMEKVSNYKRYINDIFTLYHTKSDAEHGLSMRNMHLNQRNYMISCCRLDFLRLFAKKLNEFILLLHSIPIIVLLCF